MEYGIRYTSTYVDRLVYKKKINLPTAYWLMLKVYWTESDHIYDRVNELFIESQSEVDRFN